MFEQIRSFVGEHVPEHLAGLWTPDIETQLEFASGEKYRIPRDGNGSPNYPDHDMHPDLDEQSVSALGVTGWQWRDGRSLYVTIDLDSLANHSQGHDPAKLVALVELISRIEEAEIIRSKSGEGYHVRLYFDPDNAPRALTRGQHITNARHALAWLSRATAQDMEATADAVGVVAWIFHQQRGKHGFEVLKRSTRFMPTDFDRQSEQTLEEPDASSLPLSPKHQRLIDYLTQRSQAEWADGRLTTHTHHLLMAAEDKSLGIVGSFATTAVGKDGASDRNCFLYPAENGSWRVYRFTKGTKEHESWWQSEAGWTTTWFNRGKEAKGDPAALIVSLARHDELFHDSIGRAFVTTNLNGIRETFLTSDGRYKSKLRLSYTSKTGRIVGADHLSNALAQLEAIATLECPEHPIAIRIAEHNDTLYIDLANQNRQIVAIDRVGWRVVEHCPVRFLRPFGLLPLPVPLSGGSIDDLRPFVNVDDDELPLLLTFVVACFHPAGPYALLQIIGEQGSAKSSLMRLLHDLVDPHIAIGCTLPKDERDLLVSAQLRWLVSYDNVDALSRKTSSLLCMLATGAASASRKLFTDSDQAILKAKRPVILTSIKNIVTASDLLDRTLTLMLPPIEPGQRRSEFSIEQDLRRDGVRGRIFGYILDGVASALRGHADVHRDDMPRLADVFTWATAAESGLGLPNGEVLASYGRQRDEDCTQTLTESQFALRVMSLCKTGYIGTPSECAARVDLGQSAREFSSELREIAPDLRRSGYAVDFNRSNGRRIIKLGAA